MSMGIPLARYEVSSPYGREYFNDLAQAKDYATRQSELLQGKFFLYDSDWNEDVALVLYKNGYPVID